MAIRRLDVDPVVAAYSDAPALTRALDGQVIAGRGAVERDFRDGFAGVRSVDYLTIVDRRLAVLPPDAAVLTVRVAEAYTEKSGNHGALHGTWTSVWARRNGVWRIIQDAAVHVPDPP